MADRQWAGIATSSLARALAPSLPPAGQAAAARAVAAFARALRLSCLAAQHPAHADLANRAVAAHVAARAWAEAAVREAAVREAGAAPPAPNTRP